MIGMKDSMQVGSEKVVEAYQSSTPPFQFARDTSRVTDVARQAQDGRLKNDYDPEKAYLLAVVSGWAYAEGQTLADKIQHYGFEQGAYVQQFSVMNDAVFVVARAYLVRSKDGRAGILAFRGTEPANAINWLTDADTTARDFYGRGVVHHGFHTNVEALWNYIEVAVRDAMAGKPPPSGNGGPTARLEPLQHLYVTGHSLGGAMALLAAAKIFLDENYADWRRLVRGVYTFGQPQVGDAEFERSCRPLADLVYRHEFRHDIVPMLPPTTVAHGFVHVGKKRVSGSQDEPWQVSDGPTRALRSIAYGAVCVAASFFTRRILFLRRLDGVWCSIDDHSPQRYINTSKASLEAGAEATRSARPLDRMKRMAQSAAQAGKQVLQRTGRRGPADRSPAAAP